MLSAESICLQLDGQPVLRGIDLDLRAGEFVGLIGPNGAGKSSLLRVLAGLHRADSGQVIARPDGERQGEQKPLLALDPRERGRWLAYLPQQDKPAWPLAVEHLVALGRTPWQGTADTAADKAAVERALALTDLAGLRGRPLTHLSGGELQRALLARVFAGEPRVILADEPIAALDPYHQLHVMELLRSQADHGGLVVAALHDLSLAARYCHRLLLLHGGQLLAEGEPVKVLTPDNLATAYGISAYVDCREDGVVVIPRSRQGASPDPLPPVH